METLTRLVAESLARHGFDRPVDYRRLQWSRWFRCESPHSLLTVPSRPGVFALAEEIQDIGTTTKHVGTAASAVRQSAASTPGPTRDVEERRFGAASDAPKNGALAPVVTEPSRMLAVTKFFEDDDMAFVLDRMLSRENPMRARLASGRYFVRFVVIEDASQRRIICNALNQWISSSAEKATGIGSHFATSLEFTTGAEPVHVPTAAKPALRAVEGSVPGTRSEAKAIGTSDGASTPRQSDQRRVNTAPQLNSAIATNIHCSSSFPSGF